MADSERCVPPLWAIGRGTAKDQSVEHGIGSEYLRENAPKEKMRELIELLDNEWHFQVV